MLEKLILYKNYSLKDPRKREMTLRKLITGTKEI
jgi:hypothetical protein